MRNQLTLEQQCLLDLLNVSLQPDNQIRKECVEKWMEQTIHWMELSSLAKKHAIYSLLYPCFEIVAQNSLIDQKELETSCQITVAQSYRLLYLSGYLQHSFKVENIPCVLLKGMGIASLYPIPELRKSGDIDLLIPDEVEFQRACTLLKTMGFLQKEEQLANHHISFVSKEGIEIEIHNLLVEPFDQNAVNEYLQESLCQYVEGKRIDCLGTNLIVPRDSWNAFYLLLHMLQHFLRSGFGLKLLSDWVVFWNEGISSSQEEEFLVALQESGTTEFARVITAFCVEKLGLLGEKVAFLQWELVDKRRVELLVFEIMEAEEFGKSSTDRMVMVRGNSIIAYVREFHHQMRLNYPKSSKFFFCWPFLWSKTFLVFLKNNRTIRKVSTLQIVRKARKRSELVSTMKLFEK